MGCASYAKFLLSVRHLLRWRALTSESLCWCPQEHLYRARDSVQPSTKLKDLLERQQAYASAALLPSSTQRFVHAYIGSPECSGPRQGPALQPADTTQPLVCHPELLLLLLRVSGDVHVRTFGVCCTVAQVVRLVTVQVASSRRSSREDWAQRWARASWRQAHLQSLLGAQQQCSGRRSICVRLLQAECMRMRVLASERAVLCQAVCDATPLLERAHARTCLPGKEQRAQQPASTFRAAVRASQLHAVCSAR